VYNTGSLLSEAQVAHDKVWFVQSLEVCERTDSTISLRLYIRPGLFVYAFIGEMTGSLLTFLSKVEKVLVENNLL